jgi:O-antigen/teichoic acid export membrane protein
MSLRRFNSPDFLPQAMQAYQLMRVGSVVLTSILLTKTALSTREIGVWETLLYLGSTVVFLGVNGLLQGISPVYVHLVERRAQQAFTAQVFGVFSVVAVTVFLLFWGGARWLVPALTGQVAVPHFGWYCLFLLLNLPSLPVEIFYLLRQRPARIVGWGVLNFGGQVLAVVVPIVLGWGLQGALWCLVGLALLKLLIALFDTPWQWPSRADDHWKMYLTLSAPLVANTLIANLVGLFDAWLVAQYFSNPSVFAVFRYGSREFPLALALATALGTALVPLLSAKPTEGRAELRQRSQRLFHTVMPLSALLLCTATWWFPWVFNAELAEAAGLFQIYLLVTASRVLLPNAVLLGLGDSRSIFWVGVAELVLKVLTGWLFIQWWGLPGVAWSVVLSFWFEKIALILVLEFKHRVPTPEWLHVRWYVFYTVLLLLAFALA